MITKRDHKHIETAIAHAKSSNKVAGARASAVLALRGRIIAFGTNQRKSHPFQAEYGKNPEAIFLHAEINCIKNALRMGYTVDDLRKATLYVARIKKAGSDPADPFIWGMAKPCRNGCQRCIADFGIKRVLYTTDEQKVAILT